MTSVTNCKPDSRLSASLIIIYNGPTVLAAERLIIGRFEKQSVRVSETENRNADANIKSASKDRERTVGISVYVSGRKRVRELAMFMVMY